MTNLNGLQQIEDEVNASEREHRPMKTVTTLPAVREQPTKTTALQTIARDVTRLTWREAEQMSRGIIAKLKDKDPAGLTAALQDWAWEWEVFKEEERPRRNEDV